MFLRVTNQDSYKTSMIINTDYICNMQWAKFAEAMMVRLADGLQVYLNADDTKRLMEVLGIRGYEDMMG